jgi:hypothetical protein
MIYACGLLGILAREDLEATIDMGGTAVIEYRIFPFSLCEDIIHSAIGDRQEGLHL